MEENKNETPEIEETQEEKTELNGAKEESQPKQYFKIVILLVFFIIFSAFFGAIMFFRNLLVLKHKHPQQYGQHTQLGDNNILGYNTLVDTEYYGIYTVGNLLVVSSIGNDEFLVKYKDVYSILMVGTKEQLEEKQEQMFLLREENLKIQNIEEYKEKLLLEGEDLLYEYVGYLEEKSQQRVLKKIDSIDFKNMQNIKLHTKIVRATNNLHMCIVPYIGVIDNEKYIQLEDFQKNSKDIYNLIILREKGEQNNE